MEKKNQDQNLSNEANSILETKRASSPRPAPDTGLPFYLDCPMCDEAETFVISRQDPSTGYCFAEKKAWTVKAIDLDEKITVCDHCLQASCWQGIFYCDEFKTAGTTQKTRRELITLNREHPSYWKTDEQLASE